MKSHTSDKLGRSAPAAMQLAGAADNWHVRRTAIHAGAMMSGAGRVKFATVVTIKRAHATPTATDSSPEESPRPEAVSRPEAGPRPEAAMERSKMNGSKISELLYQALETEIGGVKVYRTALRCVQNDKLRKEWDEYLEQTANHERILVDTCEQLGLDPTRDTPGRKVVRHKWKSLVSAMEMALEAGPPEAAELVAAECVVDAETKDHMNWELLGKVAEKLDGEEGKLLREAHAEVEDEEDEHLYHTVGWTRELWIKSLGMPAVLPPPEEEKKVKTAIGAARAKQARRTMLKK